MLAVADTVAVSSVRDIGASLSSGFGCAAAGCIIERSVKHVNRIGTIPLRRAVFTVVRDIESLGNTFAVGWIGHRESVVRKWEVSIDELNASFDAGVEISCAAS